MPDCSHTLARTLAGGTCPLCPIDAAPPTIDALAAVPPDAWEAELLRRSFADFVIRFWPAATGVPLRMNAAISGMVTALQAVADGKLHRLAIEIGPGLAKSTLLSLYAAWRTARDASHRAIHGSYAHEIAANNSRRARRIVDSDDFRALFGVALSKDDNTIHAWGTTEGGRYVATGVGGALTGHRANECLVDDPLNAVDSRSKAVRDASWNWFNESLSTRVDGDGPIIVVGQRLGTDDLIGRLKSAGGWTALTLPAEYDPRRPCVLLDDAGDELWRDPRREDGQLLAPSVLSRKKLDGLKVQIGSAAYASQYNQDPSSDDTATIKRSWWRFYKPEHTPPGTRRPAGCDEGRAAELPAKFDRIVIAADLTFGSAKGDFAVAQAWGAFGGARYLLEQWRQRAGFEEQLVAIAALAKRYPGAKIVVEKAANGAAVIETLAKSIPGVVPVVPLGSKLQRLSAVAPTIESGACYLPEGVAWLGDFVEELSGASRHDDAMDACAHALFAMQGSNVLTMVDKLRLIGGGVRAAETRERLGRPLDRIDRKLLAEHNRARANEVVPPRPVLGERSSRVSHDAHLEYHRQQVRAWELKYGGGS